MAENEIVCNVAQDPTLTIASSRPPRINSTGDWTSSDWSEEMLRAAQNLSCSTGYPVSPRIAIFVSTSQGQGKAVGDSVK